MIKLYPVVGVSLVLAVPTYAQYTYSPPVYTPLQSITSDVAYQGMRTNLDTSRSSNDDASVNAPRNGASISRTVNLSFPVSQQARRANLAKFASSMKKTDPASAAKIDTLFNGTDVIAQIDKLIRPMGLRANNVADAYTVWWIAAWHATHRLASDPDPVVMAAVKRQAESAMNTNPEMAAASNLQKQEFAESLLVQAALIDSGIDDAAGNATKQAALAKAVNQGAKAMGLDLTTMTLTPNGFVPRNGGRSDASDQAADNTQLAANDESGGNLALYAVAGTGLLAGVFALGKGLSKKG